MPKNRKPDSDKGWIWKGPCITALTLFLCVGITALLIQKGTIKSENLRGAILISSLLAGLAGAATGEKRRGIKNLSGAGIPALMLLAASLAGGGKGQLTWSLGFAAMLMLPSLIRLVCENQKGGHRRRKARRTG